MKVAEQLMYLAGSAGNSDHAPAAQHREVEVLLPDRLRQMKAQFDPAKLDEDARTSFDVWALELERAEARRKWRRHGYVVGRGGPQTGLPNFMINFHRVDTPAEGFEFLKGVLLKHYPNPLSWGTGARIQDRPL